MNSDKVLQLSIDDAAELSQFGRRIASALAKDGGRCAAHGDKLSSQEIKEINDFGRRVTLAIKGRS
jgi:hypothetical protein